MIVAMGSARLGKDVELRFTPSGDAVCNLSLAFSYGKKADDGRRPTQWVDATLWGKRAETLAPFLVKGGQVAVTLEDLHMESFKGRDGEMWKLVARIMDIDLMGGAPAAQESPSRPVQRAPAAPQAPGRMPARAAPVQPGFSDDDDIPF